MQENKETNDTQNVESDTETMSTLTTNNSTENSATVEETTTNVSETETVASSDTTMVATSDSMVAEVKEEVATTNQEDMAVAQTTEATTSTLSDAKKQLLIQYGIATLVIIIMGAGLMYALEQQGRVDTGFFDKITAVVNPAPAAAIVNGTKISKADYEKNLSQFQTTAAAQGIDVTNETNLADIKKQALDVLVNTELLRQAAYADGALVTDEQIDARYQEIVTSIGGEEQLAAKMLELNITEPALRKDIEGEILIQGHLSKAVDVSKITVTEKELTDAYAQISATAATGVTIPPLDEIKTQLEAQLKTNKEQELVNAYITKLREAANIETLI